MIRHLALLALAAPAFGQLPDVDIPYQKFVLDNGLTLIVHEDHKAPIVAVNVWYHVGSKNEKPGKTGFAHLFEHLMFGGSERFRLKLMFDMFNILNTNTILDYSSDNINRTSFTAPEDIVPPRVFRVGATFHF